MELSYRYRPEGAERIFEKPAIKNIINTFLSLRNHDKEDGSILSYDLSKYNIDMLNCGNVLCIYTRKKKEKYLTALQTLRSQIDGQPRTSEGGFWHKKFTLIRCGWMDCTWVSHSMLIIPTYSTKERMQKKRITTS